jgi:hypothetical protein
MGGGMGDPNGGNVNPYIATALRGYKNALDVALNAGWMGPPMGGGGGGPMGPPGVMGPYDGGRQDRPPRSDGIEVCKEYLRGRCNRKETECRFAHPPDNINISPDNTVTCCIDFIKGRCKRDPCRYFHPPEHLAARFKSGPPPGRKRPYGGGRPDEGVGDYKRPMYDESMGMY